MSLVMTKKGTPIPPLESGVYAAHCIGVIDLGEQLSEQFKKIQHRVLLVFEVVGETVTQDGEEKPRWLSREFGASLNEKANLYNALIAWRGKPFTDVELEGFDLGEMLRKPCQIAVEVVERNGKTFNQIRSIVGPPKGVKLAPTASELLHFDMDVPETHAAFDKLPEWMRARILRSPTWAALHANAEALTMDDEENEDGDKDKEREEAADAPEGGACPY